MRQQHESFNQQQAPPVNSQATLQTYQMQPSLQQNQMNQAFSHQPGLQPVGIPLTPPSQQSFYGAYSQQKQEAQQQHAPQQYQQHSFPSTQQPPFGFNSQNHLVSQGPPSLGSQTPQLKQQSFYEGAYQQENKAQPQTFSQAPPPPLSTNSVLGRFFINLALFFILA